MKRKIQGYTLIEFTIVSSLAVFILLSLFSFIKTQLLASQMLNENNKALLETDIVLSKIYQSLSPLDSDINSSFIIQPDSFELRYQTGLNTQNCLGTQVLSGTEVVDTFYLKNNKILCQSTYTSLNEVAKKDTQSVINNIKDFSLGFNGIQTCKRHIELRVQHLFQDEPDIHNFTFRSACNV